MRIIGFMVCGAGEADRYLEASLKEFERLCDDAIICGNKTDSKTEALIRKYNFWFYRDDRDWGIHQPDIKTGLLNRAAKLSPDWILALDADERFTGSFTRSEAEKLASSGEIAYFFLVVNLYNDEKHFAHDAGIQRFWNIRFYKFIPERTQFAKKNLHCGLGPPHTYSQGWHAPFYLLHYGLMKADDRAKKVERYKKYDPKAIWKGREYYNDLEKELEMRPFDSEGLLNKLAVLPDCQPRKDKPMSIENDNQIPVYHVPNTPGTKFVYLERKLNGQQIDMKESEWQNMPVDQKEQFIFRGYVGEKTGTIEEPAKVEKKKVFECPICGNKFSSQKTLDNHKQMHA